jgi:hypothetical protein
MQIGLGITDSTFNTQSHVLRVAAIVTETPAFEEVLRKI